MRNKWIHFKIGPKHLGAAFIVLFLLTNIIAHTMLSKEISNECLLTDIESTEIDEIDKGTDFILLYAEDSKPCKIMEHNLWKIKQDIADSNTARFHKMNIAKHPDLYNKYNISGVPCILILKDGEEDKRIVGVVSESNLKFIYNKTIK